MARQASFIALFLLYWAVALHNLASAGPVFQDEPWIASHAWKLASTGVFGSDLFKGLAGLETRTYEFMPLFALLQAGVLWGAGLSLWTVRFLPVALGGLTLALTVALGRRLWGVPAALLAGYLLLVVSLSAVTRYRLTGIPLIDTSRIARYDILVPVFGLTALHVRRSIDIHEWTGRRQAGAHAVVGVLAALAGLSHIYGLFWIGAFAILWLAGRRFGRPRWHDFVALLGGFLLPWFVYGVYVATAPESWWMQMKLFAPESRRDLLDWRWYLLNVVTEPSRYGPGLAPPGPGYLLRPGFWGAVLAVPAALAALVWRAGHQGDERARLVVVPTLLISSLLSLLIQPKQASYLMTTIPLLALAVAWGVVHVWRQSRRRFQNLLVLVLLAVSVEGAGRWRALMVEPAGDYNRFMAAISNALPADGPVLALHTFWLGMADRDTRAWIVPLGQRDPHYRSPPVDLAAALDEIDPAAVLVDPAMGAYFDAETAVGDSVRAWLSGAGLTQTVIVEDPVYGPMTIYRRPEAAP